MRGGVWGWVVEMVMERGSELMGKNEFVAWSVILEKRWDFSGSLGYLSLDIFARA